MPIIIDNTELLLWLIKYGSYTFLYVKKYIIKLMSSLTIWHVLINNIVNKWILFNYDEKKIIKYKLTIIGII